MQVNVPHHNQQQLRVSETTELHQQLIVPMITFKVQGGPPTTGVVTDLTRVN